MGKRRCICVLKADDIQLVHARERRTGKPSKLRIVLDHRLIEEAHAAAFADQVADELEAADADIGAEGIGRIAALLELAL